ncbi:hypothetical protein JCM9803A_62270 [Rhodococcus erythropolis]
MMLHVPKLTTPAIAAGYLRGMDQPSIHVGTSAILRPWTRDDAPAVMEAFRDPSIQRWHIRRADSIDEARVGSPSGETGGQANPNAIGRSPLPRQMNSSAESQQRG